MHCCSSFIMLFKFHVVNIVCELLFKFQVVLLFRLRVVFRVSSCELWIKTEFQVISWYSSYVFISGV